jgi:hypothetical protein
LANYKYVHYYYVNGKLIPGGLMKNNVCNKNIFTSPNTKVHFAVKVSKKHLSSVEGFLSKQKNICSFHRIEFGFDFLCEGNFSNCAEAEKFFILLFSNFKICEFEKFYVKNCV